MLKYCLHPSNRKIFTSVGQSSKPTYNIINTNMCVSSLDRVMMRGFRFPGGLCIASSENAVNVNVGLCRMSRTLTTPKYLPEFVSLDPSLEPQPQNATRFRLISYNILAQVYVKSSYFPHSPSPCLRWKARSRAVLALLSNLGADFLCLQEVDEYESFYKGNMEGYGYSSIYIQRSGQKRDGCGIFFRQERAELILQENIDYNDLVNSIDDKTLLSGDTQNNEQAGKGKDTPQDRVDPNDLRVRLKRDCVGIMAAFRLKDSYNHIVIVANTHLYWDPEWADVKLAQAKYLLSRLAKFKRLVSDRFKGTPSPLIVAGDYNSTPGDKVYQYLISGDLSSSSGSETVVNDSEDVPISLCSVYNFTKGEPKFTNCTPDFTDTLDYIFFTPFACIKPVSLLELPGPDSPEIVGGLPNFSHPSDHLPIGAEFEISSTV